MIRFRRLFDLGTEAEQRTFRAVRDIFPRVFPAEPEAIDRVEALLTGRESRDFETLLLVAEREAGVVLGFSVLLYFPEIKAAYLYYIASDPDRPARGIGGALYEASRELLIGRGARALYSDAGPDEIEKLKDPAVLEVNKSRLRFYERYGALPVAGTLYDALPNPANENYQTLLLYDPLGRDRRPTRAELRRFVERMFAAQYGFAASDPYVKKVVASIRDDPVALRPRRYRTTPAAPRSWLRPLKVVVTPRHEIHHLREKGYVERPVRVRAILRGLEGLPVEERPLRRFGEEPIRAVHDPALVSYLGAVCAQLKPDDILYPEVFPIRRPERRPRELVSRAGYFCIDTFTPLTRNVYTAARASVDCALTAADLLLHGERLAYAVCRPPGHHAERRVFGGFCFLNNAAIAAHWLSRSGKVALLDIDYHHGNGSQDIFYDRADVLFVSIHGTPDSAYPHFSGFSDEKGEGEGRGFNRNYPLRRGTGDARYLEVLDEALRHVRRFAPKWFVVSLGFDIMRGDPTGSFLISLRGMRMIGRRIGALGLPTLVVQEGGYSVWNLRHGARNFFLGLAESWY